MDTKKVLDSGTTSQTVEQPIATDKAGVPELSAPRIFNIQRYSVADGDGIRTVVFLKGCPLRCPWCSNPESMNAFFEVGHVDTLCTQCGDCIEVCEPGAITLVKDGKGVEIDRDKCTSCGECIKVCAPQALKPFGQAPTSDEYTLDEVFREIKKDFLYYNRSGGGVTLSGGEVLGQPKVAAAILRRCQAMGIDTAIETSGYGSTAALDMVVEHCDQVMFDLKIMDTDAHLKHLGVSNEPIHRNARRVVEKGIPMVIRIPLVPTMTDSKENIAAIASFVKELDADLPIHVLPYHRFGMNKFEMLDRDYTLEGVEPQTDEDLQWIVDYFADCGLNAEIIR